MKYFYFVAFLLFCSQVTVAQKLYLEDLQEVLDLNRDECEGFLFQKGYAFTKQGSGSQNGKTISVFTTKGNKLIKSPKTLIKVSEQNSKQDYVCYQIYDRYEFEEFERTIKEEENFTRSDTIGSDRSRQYHKEGYKISFETKRESDKNLYSINLYHSPLAKKRFSLPRLFKGKVDESQ